MFCILSQCFSFSVYFICILGKVLQFVCDTIRSMFSSHRPAPYRHINMEFCSDTAFVSLKPFSIAFLSFLSFCCLFCLTCFSCQLVPFPWSLSSCMPRSFLKMPLNSAKHHFPKRCPPSGSWWCCFCSLFCSILTGPWADLTPLYPSGRDSVLAVFCLAG